MNDQEIANHKSLKRRLADCRDVIGRLPHGVLSETLLSYRIAAHRGSVDFDEATYYSVTAEYFEGMSVTELVRKFESESWRHVVPRLNLILDEAEPQLSALLSGTYDLSECSKMVRRTIERLQTENIPPLDSSLKMQQEVSKLEARSKEAEVPLRQLTKARLDSLSEEEKALS